MNRFIFRSFVLSKSLFWVFDSASSCTDKGHDPSESSLFGVQSKIRYTPGLFNKFVPTTRKFWGSPYVPERRVLSTVYVGQLLFMLVCVEINGNILSLS